MTEQALELLDRLTGSWSTEASHPALPGVVVHGTAEFSWLEGERFLIQRGRTDHPDFPDSIWIIGFVGRDRVEDGGTTVAAGRASRLCAHYFDSRGVFRVYDVAIDSNMWRMSRDAPGFSQRFAGSLTEGANIIDSRWELSEDDVTWRPDLAITYRREKSG